jgi:hypothetical protein
MEGGDDQTEPGAQRRLIRLRRRGTCRSCSQTLEPGQSAWWEASTKTVVCTQCRPKTQPTTGPPIESSPLDVGVAGGSAQEKHDRLHQRRKHELERRWGRLAGVAKFLSDDPRSITVWAQGSKGERILAEHMSRALGDRAVLLHDRKVPGDRRNIDHLAVAASGVWVIDTKRWSGLVELRDVGGWFRVDRRLYVKGRDRTEAVDGMAWQVEAVREALVGVTLDVPLHAAACFVEAEWKWFAKPFELKGVRVSGPESLAVAISEAGPLSLDGVMEVARRLAAALPSKVG